MPKLAKNNTLVPAPLYLEGLDCYAIVVARDQTSKTELWRQPIAIFQNRYASPLLNDWDGTFEIDEQNGTIMSSMIAAGKKDEIVEDEEVIDNVFSGVLMGDVSLGAQTGFGDGEQIGLSNHSGLGIYGFHYGAQSFGFNVDGSAFLGKSGRGRIIFNGNYGVIA